MGMGGEEVGGGGGGGGGGGVGKRGERWETGEGRFPTQDEGLVAGWWFDV